ncbi:MAG: hypothetical protein A4E57_04784 [Syntrophorhabdaceae bacterium PtaU1.Bin034]|nr:MAG: hypothetical protein A4E57_04784 [Syntrophorhabdaceae bacterium PtaU1.Bin034]
MPYAYALAMIMARDAIIWFPCLVVMATLREIPTGRGTASINACSSDVKAVLFCIFW